MPAMLYSTTVYVLFLGTFIHAILFIANLLVPNTLDGPARAAPLHALAVDAALLALFAVQHSVMARKSVKAWLTRFVPHEAERSTFVLAASACLFLLCFCWQPIEGAVWSVTSPAAVLAVQSVFWAGWGVLLLATFLINHFELFGLRQAYAKLTGRKIPEPEFRTPFLYKHVRHPIYLGFVLSFWATPEMSLGHLLFAAGGTGYILIGIWFEERDLIAQFGSRYRRYREQVGMLFPRPPRPRSSGPASRAG
jgi:protein-S-isoprenylcysteine O-methyltransferase Ste14